MLHCHDSNSAAGSCKCSGDIGSQCHLPQLGGCIALSLLMTNSPPKRQPPVSLSNQPGGLTASCLEMQRKFWSSKDCPAEPQEAADKCRYVWLVKQMNLDVDVGHLMTLVARGVDIVQNFQPPSPPGHIDALPDSSSLPGSNLASDGAASLLLPAQPSGNAGRPKSSSTAAQQGAHQPHGNPDSGDSALQRPPLEFAMDDAAGNDAVHEGRPVGPEGASENHTADANGQEQPGSENQAETLLGAKPGNGSGAAMHGPKLRSMLQPKADGRISTRPLAHVPVGVMRLASTSLREHRSRLIHKQRS